MCRRWGISYEFGEIYIVKTPLVYRQDMLTVSLKHIVRILKTYWLYHQNSLAVSSKHPEPDDFRHLRLARRQETPLVDTQLSVLFEVL